MTTTIFLIRHGEVYNPEGTLYGRLPNFGLSDKGKQQLEKTAKYLKDKRISLLYASPLQRTRESAEIIKNKLNLPEIHTSEEILEAHTSYQGGKFSDLDALQSEVYLKPKSPTDETIEQIYNRMQRFINLLIKTYPGKNITVVSHGDPIVILKTAIQKKKLSFNIFKTNDYIKHGEVYQITADDKKNLSIKNVFTPKV
jgi:broad specificity phosphatase PhoE